MKCKGKRCALESRHKGKCSEVGPYTVVNEALAVVNNDQRGTPLDQPLIRVATEPQRSRRDVSERRQTKWQRDNRERYNKRMREYMRLKRAGFIGIAYG
jgi:carbonic anhydrase/acetyltransferase-like protein (isoleucine patch superfamily)